MKATTSRRARNAVLTRASRAVRTDQYERSVCIAVEQCLQEAASKQPTITGLPLCEGAETVDARTELQASVIGFEHAVGVLQSAIERMKYRVALDKELTGDDAH
jgi:hypothetical protein